MKGNFLRILFIVYLIFSVFHKLYAEEKKRYVQIIIFREEREEKFINFSELCGNILVYDKSDEEYKQAFLKSLELVLNWNNKDMPRFRQRELKDPSKVGEVIKELLRREVGAIFIIDTAPLKEIESIWEFFCEEFDKEKRRVRLELIPISKEIIEEMNVQMPGHFSVSSIKAKTYFTYEDIRTAKIEAKLMSPKSRFHPQFGLNYIQKTGKIFVYAPELKGFQEAPSHTTFGVGAEFIKFLSKKILLSCNLAFNLKTKVEIKNSLNGEKITAETYPSLDLVINGGYNVINSEELLLYPFGGGGINYFFGKQKEYTSDQGNLIKIDPSKRNPNFKLNGGIGFIIVPSNSGKLELLAKLSYVYIFIENGQRGISFEFSFRF